MHRIHTSKRKKMFRYLSLAVLIIVLSYDLTEAYSALEDERIINAYKYQQLMLERQPDLNHAKIARTLVNHANWAAVGTISTNRLVTGYPMVNVISIDDNDSKGVSTGKIHFMLTDLDFTGPDWRYNNKATFLFSNDQHLDCENHKQDPMEPTCARVIISGQVKQMGKSDQNYDDALVAFVQRHPAAKNWIKAHTFYLCELDIKNIFVLDYYGGPHNVTADDYYNIML
ncbi:cellular Repressor of E1A-stimulated Genes isoform 1-T1 [Glossina fuscipes fuscipes]